MDNKNVSGLLKAAKVLMIINTVIFGLAIIPLAWSIPMTINYSNKLKNGEKISLGLKICTLFFVTRIGGLLMLCDTSQMEKAPQEPPEIHKNVQ